MPELLLCEIIFVLNSPFKQVIQEKVIVLPIGHQAIRDDLLTLALLMLVVVVKGY